MFENLRRHDQIFVTGPQRSGTTIATKMIAQELGYKYYDETCLPESFDGFILQMTHDNLDGIKGVYQGPTKSALCHTLSKDIAIVFMMRPIDEIIASQVRINWIWEDQEIAKYPKEYQDTPVSSLKYRYWNEVQKPLIKYSYEITFGSLRNHPLWLGKEERKNFNSNI